jgi:hypothetical protein
VAGLIALVLLFLGQFPVLAVAVAVEVLVPVPALYYAMNGVGQLLLVGLICAFVVVYAADVRVRREGLDLVPEAAPAG